jgi:hypothetical protein
MAWQLTSDPRYVRELGGTQVRMIGQGPQVHSENGMGDRGLAIEGASWRNLFVGEFSLFETDGTVAR